MLAPLVVRPAAYAWQITGHFDRKLGCPDPSNSSRTCLDHEPRKRTRLRHRLAGGMLSLLSAPVERRGGKPASFIGAKPNPKLYVSKRVIIVWLRSRVRTFQIPARKCQRTPTSRTFVHAPCEPEAYRFVICGAFVPQRLNGGRAREEKVICQA